MSEPLVSVIIPNYNYGRFLAEAIDSVLAQTYANVEVLVVDDGSTDDSLSVLRGYGDRIRWFPQRNQGVSAARNLGIRESKGAILAFLDADDAWKPEKLARQIPLLQNPEVGMVYCGLELMNADGQPLGTRVTGCSGRPLREMALLRGEGVPASGSSAIVSRACLDKVGLFDTALSTGADWDMWRRIACHFTIEIVREPLTRYRLHGTGMHRNVDVFAKDKLRSFATMFADPAAAELLPLRRRCYANLYVTLAGSFRAAGRHDKCFACLLRALMTWPPSLSYAFALPLRHRRQARLEPSLDQ